MKNFLLVLCFSLFSTALSAMPEGDESTQPPPPYKVVAKRGSRPSLLHSEPVPFYDATPFQQERVLKSLENQLCYHDFIPPAGFFMEDHEAKKPLSPEIAFMYHAVYGKYLYMCHHFAFLLGSLVANPLERAWEEFGKAESLMPKGFPDSAQLAFYVYHASAAWDLEDFRSCCASLSTALQLNEEGPLKQRLYLKFCLGASHFKLEDYRGATPSFLQVEQMILQVQGLQRSIVDTMKDTVILAQARYFLYRCMRYSGDTKAALEGFEAMSDLKELIWFPLALHRKITREMEELRQELGLASSEQNKG